MATISQILTRRWPGREWTITADDYATLIWGHLDENGQVVNTNPEAKPTLEEIQAFANDVDLEIAIEERDAQREDELIIKSGELFKAFDIISDYLTALHLALPSNVRSDIPANVVNRAQALRNAINTILANNP